MIFLFSTYIKEGKTILHVYLFLLHIQFVYMRNCTLIEFYEFVLVVLVIFMTYNFLYCLKGISIERTGVGIQFNFFLDLNVI